MIEKILRTIERFVPRTIYRALQPAYHFLLALVGALYYRFPSRTLTVIFITGTKGKTSTAEIMNNILEASGATTALLGTLRFKIGANSTRNMRKMTIPGRFFVQRFLRDAVRAGCTHAVIEMTSEGAKQFRHRFIDADALIFLNLSPEHIESHGSYEAYRNAKLSIAHALARSQKPRRLMVANTDDKEGALFLALPGLTPLPFSKKDGEPIDAREDGITLLFKGERITSALSGLHNAENIIAAATLADALGIPTPVIAEGVARTHMIRGRGERVEKGQPFPVVVDYAHTPDSLEAIYSTFKGHQLICVLGNTGGGRDTWKRPVMGHIAETHCTRVILSNEDPYDEDPEAIVAEMKNGMGEKTPEVILDRRSAIARALTLAKETPNSAVILTGKGTDPFIMGPNGTRTPWDEAGVTREELGKLGYTTTK